MLIRHLVRSCHNNVLQYKKLISEHSVFPLVIVCVQQQEACTHVIPMPESHN